MREAVSIESICLPEQILKNLETYFGEPGLRWAAHFPAQLSKVLEEWQLTLLQPFANLTFNFVSPVLLPEGQEAVLKMGYPNPDFAMECHALRHFNGQGAVKLLKSDSDSGKMIIEQIQPGTSLKQMNDDDKVTRIAAGVMQGLWRPFNETKEDAVDFPTIADWLRALPALKQRFEGGAGPLDAELVTAAQQLSAELMADVSEPVLLHGDLHHDNIISASSEAWVAIDPKGVVGEPAYEVGALLRNPSPSIYRQCFKRRVEILAEMLDIDRERVVRWAFVQAVLSAVWAVDGSPADWGPVLEFARQIRPMV